MINYLDSTLNRDLINNNIKNTRDCKKIQNG